jgi:hypothetical protein
MVEDMMDKTGEPGYKIRLLEVLLAIKTAGRTGEWFEGTLPSNYLHTAKRGKATRDLQKSGLIEKDNVYPAPTHPHPYRLTTKGLSFFDEVMRRIGKDNSVHWKRVKEIEFSLQ